MDVIMGLVAWFQANGVQVIAAITSIIGAVSIIVKLTPTLKDDSVWLPIVKFLAKYLALNVEKPTERPV